MTKLLSNLRAMLFASITLRSVAAYALMLTFIITTSVGVAMIYPPAGWITLGVTCGFVGYLLGAE
jgi:hypothetical protein